MKTVFILCLLSLCLYSTSHGQEGKMFTVDKDLSSSMLNKIYQDRDGIIWIATEDGLNRYDGAKFTVYRNEKSNGSSKHGSRCHHGFIFPRKYRTVP